MVWNAMIHLSCRVGHITTFFATLHAKRIAVLAQNPRFQNFLNSDHDDSQTTYVYHRGA